jgi:hypothetical protein
VTVAVVDRRVVMPAPSIDVATSLTVRTRRLVRFAVSCLLSESWGEARLTVAFRVVLVSLMTSAAWRRRDVFDRRRPEGDTAEMPPIRSRGVSESWTARGTLTTTLLIPAARAPARKVTESLTCPPGSSRTELARTRGLPATVQVNVVVLEPPAPSAALTVTVVRAARVGVPEINPLTELMLMPAGRPSAL